MRKLVVGAFLRVYERAGGLTYGEVEVGQKTVIFDSPYPSPAWA
jgi:hypothetical protein